ncbi:carbohydrate ABC transporter permease [Nesterenkonia sp. Act20]|uniref:carbohydrate ABC transporter permease n=1 Tax=Nesterenkonia sp. Act20 TaxID=1483432 RepID=UPI0020FFFC1B|nr:sugar ABC transporter permease [Nesterenkonia sp. Act20]
MPAVLLVFSIHYVATAFGGFYAFTDWTGIGSFEWIGVQNFTEIFADAEMLLALGNTLFLAFGSVLVANVMGLALALGLNRGLKTRYWLRVLFFMPVVLSPLATAYVWRYIFDFDGPLNAFLTAVGLGDFARAWVADPTFAIWVVLLVIAWQTTGIPMVIFMAGLAGVPQEMEEAAAIDGASTLQRLWFVVLPSLRPAIAISTILGIVNGLRIFDPILAITGGGPAGVTENLATVVYKESFALGNFGYGAALALVLTLIIIFFAVVQQRLTQERKD